MNTPEIRAIIGLGNPGRQYTHTRHNIGFLVVEALADQHGASWHTKGPMESATIEINNNKIILVKPQTFMNLSGQVIPLLNKQGIKAENIVVVHDELELPFGKLKFKIGGSAKGHNGLRSIIGNCGDGFVRLRFGVGRPERPEMVPNYVLENFKEDAGEVERLINDATHMIVDALANPVLFTK